MSSSCAETLIGTKLVDLLPKRVACKDNIRGCEPRPRERGSTTAATAMSTMDERVGEQGWDEVSKGT
jgi:hypothetical protein